MSANERQVSGKHYQRGIQHWDYVLSKGIPYMEAQIIKYVERWRHKNGIDDLHKAQHFLEKLIEHETENVKDEASKVIREKHREDIRKSIENTLSHCPICGVPEDIVHKSYCKSVGPFRQEGTETDEPLPHGYVNQD